MLNPRYYDSKMNTVYTLENLREEHYLLKKSELSEDEFEKWIKDLVEGEVLIPIE